MRIEISATEPEWSRERAADYWDPGRRLLRSLRDYQKWKARGGAWARPMAQLCVLRHRFWSVICGAHIPLDCQIEGGLLIPHPNGIVIHHETRIGPNCLILQQVTLGTNGPLSRVPVIGGHVDIGAGAKILGDVRVGDHAKIGANAVVLSDVPAGATAVGVPARIVGTPCVQPKDEVVSDSNLVVPRLRTRA